MKGDFLRSLFLSLAVFALLSAGSVFAQGNLPPPGAPAPTMKSLDQIEPRTPVDAAHTPGDANNVFVINQPGSYYLTTNIFGATNKSGIGILTNNVVLDLRGFSLFGISGAHSGIAIPNSTTTNIVIRNGIINGWGVNYLGVESSARNGLLECLTVSGNSYGVSVAANSVVRDCVVNGNSASGIVVNGS